MGDVVGDLAAPLLDERKAETPRWRRELVVMLQLAAPTVLTSAVQQVMIVANQMAAGRVGTAEMAAAALANTWWSLMWYFLLGTSTALDTLGSQAFGAGEVGALNTWTFCSVTVLTAVSVPIAALLWYGDVVAAVLFRQGPLVASHVGRFCRLLIPGLLPAVWSQVLQKYLQVQNEMVPPAIASVITIVFTFVANVVGVAYAGFDGVPLATSAARVLMLLLLAAAVAGHEFCSRNDGVRKRWAYSLQRSFRPQVLSTFVGLAIPGALMMGLECASFEVTTAMAGVLGEVEVAAHSGVFSLVGLAFIALPFAVATSATIRVGNLVGAGQAEAACGVGHVAVAVGIAFMAASGLLLIGFRNQLGWLFTANDVRVVAAVALIAPLAGAYQVADGVLGTSQGVLRGIGRQTQCLVVNLFGFYVVGLPTGYTLTFVAHWGLLGLWVGITAGVVVVAALNLTLMLLVDWHAEVARVTSHAELQRTSSSTHNRLASGELQRDLFAHLAADVEPEHSSLQDP